MTRTARFGLLATAFVVLLVVFGIVSVSAQGSDLQIGEATLQLWPEYDDPGVLVIFSGSLTGTVNFPQTVGFAIPAGARNVQATYQDASGTLVNRQFEIKDGKLTYELPSGNFHLEYYFDRQPSGNDRTISYSFDAAYPIESLVVIVQQPARATGFSLEPAPQISGPRDDNLTYHSFTKPNVAAGEKLDLKIKYAKTDTGVSAPQLTVTESSGSPAPAAQSPSTSESNAWLPYLLIGVGVVALAAAGTYWLLSQRKPAPASVVRPAKGGAASQPRPTVKAASSSGQPGVFCTQCGRPLRPDDRFCSQCGAPRRN